MGKETNVTPRGRGSILLAALQKRKQQISENIETELPQSEQVIKLYFKFIILKL